MNRTNRLPVESESTIRVLAANADVKAEVKVPRIAAVRVRNGRPVVAALARAVRGSTVAPAGSGKEDTVTVPLGSEAHTFDTIQDDPFLVAVVY